MLARKVQIGLIVFLIIMIVVMQLTTLGVNQTCSLKHKLFLTLNDAKFRRNDLVTFNKHKTAYLKNIYFTKYVRGVAGDTISVDRQFIYINKHKVGAAKKITKKGLPLTPIRAQIIPSGYIFVVTPHPDSFDSRYQEFGLVSTKDICGRVIASW